MHCVQKKYEAREFLEQLLLGLMKFYKIWRDYCESTHDTTTAAFSLKPAQHFYPRCTNQPIKPNFKEWPK